MAHPDDVEVYRETRVFTAADVPAALRGAHSTRAGVWGRLVVLEGTLTFVDERPGGSTLRLEPGEHDLIEPEAPHRVDPSPECRFQVRFLRRVSSPDASR